MELARRVLRSSLVAKHLKRGQPRELYASFEIEPPAKSSFFSELERDFYNHTGRQVSKWGHYLEVYDRFFAPLRNAGKPLRILELGVQHGGSLQLWQKYFGPQAKIAGIDIDPRSEFNSENIKVFIGSQTDPDVLNRAVDWLDELTIVIDDGSHVAKHQNLSLDLLFPRLAPGGLYICEDLHTNYWWRYGGGYAKGGTFIDRMKRLIDDIHEWSHRYGAKDHVLAGQVFGLHVYDSIVVIEKREIARPFHTRVGSPAF
jgi:hypothetical protein